MAGRWSWRCHERPQVVALGIARPGTRVLVGCDARQSETGRRVVVLGVDGLDYQLVRDLMARGRMPHFEQLAKSGHFSALATSTPPQSPVAWSTFITGLDPGQHGVFDFIHRDPKTLKPFLSTARTQADARKIAIGRWQFPLAADRVESLRRGEAFWSVLERHGIETTIIRMPANFPPSRTATRELSGMGTPDLLGTYGTFSLFTSQPAPADRTAAGGIIVPVDVADGVIAAAIEGPDNPYLVEPHKTRVDFTAYIDSADRYVKLVVGNEQRLLRVGEWSDWVPVELPLLPFVKLTGECRFYLKQIRSVLRDVREPDQRRSVEAGAADLHTPWLRVGARPRDRPLLHAGDARGDERLEGGRADSPGVPGAGPPRRRRKHPSVPVTCSTGSTTDSSSTTSATSTRCRI